MTMLNGWFLLAALLIQMKLKNKQIKVTRKLVKLEMEVLCIIHRVVGLILMYNSFLALLPIIMLMSKEEQYFGTWLSQPGIRLQLTIPLLIQQDYMETLLLVSPRS